MAVPKILILTSDVGGGHRSVAQSMAAALEELHPGRFFISTVDFLIEGAPWPLRHIGRGYACAVTYLRLLWHLAYHITDGRHRARLARWAALPFYGLRLQGILRRVDPDVVISCHPLSSAAWAGALPDRCVPVVVVVSDLTAIHALWVSPDVDLCLVPTEIARQRALAYGMPPDRIQVVGLPVHPAFNRQGEERGELRERWGLAPQRFTAVLCGGGEGIGPLQRIVEVLDDPALPLQLVVVCGHNEGLRRRLAARAWRVPARVLGFIDTDRMSELLRLADCLLTKAGPSSIAEGLVCGLPLVLFDFVPGQEEGNVGYVLDSGAGFFAPTPQRARQAVEHLLADPLLRQRMMSAARAIARPGAAWEAAQRMAELLPRDG